MRTTEEQQAQEAGTAADRDGNLMVIAMVVCCAAIPLAVLAAVLAGGFGASTIGPWGWALLGAAVLAAFTMVWRVTRTGR